MPRHALAILGCCLLGMGCASTRQPPPARPNVPPMIGQRQLPPTLPPTPALPREGGGGQAPTVPVSLAKGPVEKVVRTTIPPTETPPGRPAPPPVETPVKPAVATPPAAEVPARPAALDTPVLDTPPVDQAQKLRSLYTNAAQRYAAINDYICRFRRREFVNGKQEPEDLLEFKFRKEPYSIYFKWIGGQLVGRELVYVKGKYDGKMQIRTGRGDVIAGFRTSLDPHSARATANSRRTIDEASFGNLIDGYGQALAAAQQGTPGYGSLRFVGLKERQEFELPLDCVEQRLPPGAEKHLPRGGTRFWYFNRDDRTRDYELPVLIITLDDQQREVEYYCYDRVNTNVGLKAEEFDPDVIWRRKN